MSTLSTHRTDNAREPCATEARCCKLDVRIDCRGDVNINNCPAPGASGTPPSPPACPPGFPPYGACLPVVPGAKHKLGRDYKLNKLAARMRVPSALAAGTLHAARRFVLGKPAANPLETALFATLAKIPRDLLSCSVAAFDALPPPQRNRLFAPTLLLDADQPLDPAGLTAALAQEIKQRTGIALFDDPQGADQERPGRIRVYEPQGEDFFSQVRICRVNDLRTASYIPPLDMGALLPAEIQQDCNLQLVNGQPQSVCQVRTADCPGNTLGSVCGRVLDIAAGDGVTLEGVNYFSVDAKVRFTDRQTGATVRDVDAHVWGDTDTPATEVIGGNTVLINDCRVHDRLSFQIPDDLAPMVYQIQVVVPNVTGIAALGSELSSNVEFINVIPSPSARFQIVTESIYARKETSPGWLGSDEVGLRVLAVPLFADGSFGDVQEQKYTDIQDVDFDSGTRRDITRKVFEHDQPILGVVMSILGHEIDSQRAYNQQITASTDFFVDLVKQQAGYAGAAISALGGAAALAKLGWVGALVIGIAIAVTLAIDLIVALWAPADLIIQDALGLTIGDLAALTSVNAPMPAASSHTTEDDIVVNINKTVAPIKLPLEYHETREYVSDDQDSRYELTCRYNRVS